MPRLIFRRCSFFLHRVFFHAFFGDRMFCFLRPSLFPYVRSGFAKPPPCGSYLSRWLPPPEGFFALRFGFCSLHVCSFFFFPNPFFPCFVLLGSFSPFIRVQNLPPFSPFCRSGSCAQRFLTFIFGWFLCLPFEGLLSSMVLVPHRSLWLFSCSTECGHPFPKEVLLLSSSPTDPIFSGRVFRAFLFLWCITSLSFSRPGLFRPPFSHLLFHLCGLHNLAVPWTPQLLRVDSFVPSVFPHFLKFLEDHPFSPPPSNPVHWPYTTPGQ